MDDQLASDLVAWGLDKKFFIALVTDTASNMNLLGKMVEERYSKTKHHYCTAHNLQLMAIKAFTGDIGILEKQFPDGIGDEEEALFDSLWQACNLVSHMHQSSTSKEKFDAAQK